MWTNITSVAKSTVTQEAENTGVTDISSTNYCIT